MRGGRGSAARRAQHRKRSGGDGCCRLLSASLRSSIAESVRHFKGVEHRIELAGRIRGIEFYNDSKATNVDSAIKAVESFDGNIILILGGKDKGASYAPLVEAMSGRVKHVLLVGSAAPKISAAIGNSVSKNLRHDDGRCRGEGAWDSERPAMLYCFHRLARVSTCSRITNTAAACSRKQ